MNPILRAAVFTFLPLLLAPPAFAEPISGCYIRAYSADHMAKNPKQRIQRIVLERLEDLDPVTIGIVAGIKGDKRRWDAGGSCKTEGDALDCGLDGDRGRVKITPVPEGARLEVVTYIGFEADKPDGDLDHKSFSDAAHKVFVLPRAKVKDCK
jgi:hypothetical protein